MVERLDAWRPPDPMYAEPRPNHPNSLVRVPLVPLKDKPLDQNLKGFLRYKPILLGRAPAVLFATFLSARKERAYLK